MNKLQECAWKRR